jgi:nitrate reductase NapE component
MLIEYYVSQNHLTNKSLSASTQLVLDNVFKPPRSKIGEHIAFVLFVILLFCFLSSAKNFNFGYNFWMVSTIGSVEITTRPTARDTNSAVGEHISSLRRLVRHMLKFPLRKTGKY